MKLHAEDWPDVIKIDRTLYRLVVTNDLEEHGLCDAEGKTIKIRPSSIAGDLDTLIHEFLHGCEEEYSIKLSHRQVYRLARAFSRLILDNPMIFHSIKDD